MNPFRIRQAQDTDLNFIYKTTLDNYRYDSVIGKTCTNTVFYKEYQQVLDHILLERDTKVLVACHVDEPNVIYGYLIYELPNILHYTFVKESFRNLKIAKSLFLEAFQEGMGSQIVATHKTREVDTLFRNNARLVYNPFLLYKTHKE